MPKRARTTPHPHIALDASLPEPLYKQLYDRLRTAILGGQIEGGVRLPSTRTLAAELGVSRNTTALAYEMLLLEGYLESRVGQGTTVASRLPAPPPTRPTERLRRQTSTGEASGTIPIRIAARVHALEAVAQGEPTGFQPGAAFRAGEPALDLFPYQLWGRLVARRARHGLAEHAHYQSPAGYAPLCEAVAAHIGITRGVRCSPDQIIITAGSQGALDLAVRTLLNPGDPAWIENPGYFGARSALLAAGARLVPVPVDEEGIDVEAGRQLYPEARLASTTPSHQFPTTVTMSLSRRLALLDWAARNGAYILEDDYDSEYRFSGRPLEALQGLDHEGRVLYIGTFSKVLFPALRIGYLVAPAELIEPLLTMRRTIDVHVPILEQMALADFIQEGHYARHLRRMRGRYRRRRDVLLAELSARLGGLLEVHAPEAGMHLAGWLPPRVDDRLASALAEQAGIRVTALSAFSLGQLPRGGLLFGFAGADEPAIRSGVEKLAEALKALRA